MTTPLILARSFKAAHTFATEELGLRVGHYRVVNTAGTLKAVRGVDLHLVPGWDKSPSHFAMKTAMRYCHLNIIDHAAQAQEPKPTEVIITAVPDETPVPQHHEDMVAKVLPGLQHVGDGETDFFDAVDVPGLPAEEPEPVAVCVACGLTPCEEDCKTAVPEAVAQVTQDDEASDAERARMAMESQPGYHGMNATTVSLGEALAMQDPALADGPQTWVCDSCMKPATREQIADMADGEHVLCNTCVKPEPEPVVEEKPKKAKRRSRCKDCGNLHYKDEPCPEAD